MKTLASILAICAAALLAAPLTASAADKASCEKSADDMKLAGAARNSHVKKCLKEAPAASAACTKSADDKKLHGAARNSHIKKCETDAKGAAAPASAVKH